MNLLKTIREHSIRKVYLAIAILFLVSLSIPSPQHVVSAQPTGLIIPLYSYPGSTWQSVVQVKQSNPSVPIVAVINPDNGPGTYQDSNFVQGINTLRSEGIIVLGYTHTSYAARSQGDVIADINSYKQWYNVSGIFFDEMSNVPGYESYYSQLSSYAKSLGYTMTVGNPGTSTPSSYLGSMDVLTIYESAGLPAISDLASWTSGNGKSNFAMVSFGVGSVDPTFVSSASNYVGWMYLTDANLPNPYDTLPSYISSLAGELNSGGSSPPSPQTILFTINSIGVNGIAISGLWTVIQSPNGTTLASGYTSFNYSAIAGEQYVVSVSNYQNFVFSHWSNGNTASSITISSSQSTALVAYYQSVQTQSGQTHVTNLNRLQRLFEAAWLH